jgi:HD-like signal output (HDOD) protein
MSTASAQPTTTPSSNGDAFVFVQDLAAQLSRGQVELPSFPNIALRVREVLADAEVSPQQVERVISSEPALAAQLLQMANSAAFKPAAKRLTDLRAAVARLGFDLVRSASIAFATRQLKNVESLKGLERPLDELWRRTADVASMSYVVAKRLSRINPDTALLTGLLHSMGRLYILTRASRYPALFSDLPSYHAILRDWSAPVAKALLESWNMPDEIVTAVSEFENHDREHDGAADLTDVLTLGSRLALFKSSPDSIELNLQGVSACKRLEMDWEGCLRLLDESESEIAAVHRALGL